MTNTISKNHEISDNECCHSDGHHLKESPTAKTLSDDNKHKSFGEDFMCLQMIPIWNFELFELFSFAYIEFSINYLF